MILLHGDKSQMSLIHGGDFLRVTVRNYAAPAVATIDLPLPEAERLSRQLIDYLKQYGEQAA